MQMSALSLSFAERGVHTLPAYTGAGYLVLYAVTSNHRVVGKRILKPGVDHEVAERELLAILEMCDPRQLRLVDESDTAPPSIFESRAPEVSRAIILAMRSRFLGPELT